MAVGWTLDELADRVGRALSGGTVTGPPGVPNGRARQVPDRRAIRWYTTIGLVDRPLAAGGRLARYGPRHLRQLVAVKRLQAQGRSLAEIQADLAGASDEALAAIAQLPDDALDGGSAPPPTSSGGREERGASGGNRAEVARFWAAGPRATALRPSGEGATAPDGARADRPDPVECAAPEPMLTGVPLGGGAVLLLPAAPTPADLEVIMIAARQLLDALAARDLLDTNPKTGDRRSAP